MLVKCNLPVKRGDRIVQPGVLFECTKKEAEAYRRAGGVVTKITEEHVFASEPEAQE